MKMATICQLSVVCYVVLLCFYVDKKLAISSKTGYIFIDREKERKKSYLIECSYASVSPGWSFVMLHKNPEQITTKLVEIIQPEIFMRKNNEGV